MFINVCMFFLLSDNSVIIKILSAFLLFINMLHKLFTL